MASYKVTLTMEVEQLNGEMTPSTEEIQNAVADRLEGEQMIVHTEGPREILDPDRPFGDEEMTKTVESFEGVRCAMKDAKAEASLIEKATT